MLIIILSNHYVPVPTGMSIDLAALIFGLPFRPVLESDGKPIADQVNSFSGIMIYDGFKGVKAE